MITVVCWTYKNFFVTGNVFCYLECATGNLKCSWNRKLFIRIKVPGTLTHMGKVYDLMP